MVNIIEKLGFKKVYWFGMATPPLMVFVFFAIENTHSFRELSKLVEKNIFHGYVPGSFAIGLLWMIIGVVVPLLALGKIKCPKCKKRLALLFLNKGHSEKNPFFSTKCPCCGYNPVGLENEYKR